MFSSGIVFLASLIIFVFAALAYFKPRLFERNIAHRSRNFFETTPARQLVPRLEAIAQPGDALLVVSATGRYPDSEPGGGLWVNALTQLMAKGVSVEYVLSAGLPAGANGIISLAARNPKMLKIKYIDKKLINSRCQSEVAMDLFETHPTFLMNDSGSLKALWLERFHNPENKMAFDVSYISPKDIMKSNLAAEYFNKVASLEECLVQLDLEEVPQLCEDKTIAA